MLSIGSYNVLNAYHAVKWNDANGVKKSLSKDEIEQLMKEGRWRENSNWDERKAILAKNIKKVDVACLQEVSEEALKELCELTGYRVASFGFHSSITEEQKFGNAILVFPAPYINVCNLVNFGAEHHSGRSIRRAAMAVISAGSKVFKIASVHLNGYDASQQDVNKKESSKERGYTELRDYLKVLEENNGGIDGLIVAGDFNEDPSEENSKWYRLGCLYENGYQTDGNKKPTEPMKNRRIDWIGFKVLSEIPFSLIPMNLEDTLPMASDHLMTGTKIMW